MLELRLPFVKSLIDASDFLSSDIFIFIIFWIKCHTTASSSFVESWQKDAIDTVTSGGSLMNLVKALKNALPTTKKIPPSTE